MCDMDELESRVANLEDSLKSVKKSKKRKIKINYFLQFIYTIIILTLFIFSDLDHSEIANLVQITQQLMLFPNN
jgi:t-SNARE complex subunit (syntaxin)